MCIRTTLGFTMPGDEVLAAMSNIWRGSGTWANRLVPWQVLGPEIGERHDPHRANHRKMAEGGDPPAHAFATREIKDHTYGKRAEEPANVADG